jgi:hypothetical protein
MGLGGKESIFSRQSSFVRLCHPWPFICRVLFTFDRVGFYVNKKGKRGIGAAPYPSIPTLRKICFTQIYADLDKDRGLSQI